MNRRYIVLISLIVVALLPNLFYTEFKPTIQPEPDQLSYTSFLESISKDSNEQTRELAWLHRTNSHQLAKENKDLFPGLNANGSIATLSNMGFHTGYCPAALLEILSHYKTDSPINILDIGSGYGLDSIALAELYPQAKITAIELDAQQIEAMNQILSRQAGDSKDRVSTYAADFLQGEKLNLPSNHYDLVILSKVLHFYDREKMGHILDNIHPLLKPEGLVLISSISNKSSPVIYYASKILGERLPIPDPSAQGYYPEFQWITFSSPELLKELAEDKGYQVNQTKYISGGYHVTPKEDWGFFRPDMSQLMLMTLLQKY